MQRTSSRSTAHPSEHRSIREGRVPSVVRLGALLCVVALLSGCAVANRLGQLASAQQYSGVTEITIRCFDPRHLPDEVTALYENRSVACVLDQATARTGKEYEQVDLQVDLAKGTISFAAAKVSGFKGQDIRAAAEKAFSESSNETIRQLGPALTEALMRALLPAPPVSGPVLGPAGTP